MSRKTTAAAPGAEPCPCGGRAAGASYADCCGRYIDHWATRPAPDAEALMRSRYSAFVRENAPYLLATWHAGTRPPALDFEPGVQWLGLQVRRHTPLGAMHAEVEFVARSRLHGRATRLHERSRFVRENAADGTVRWCYVDGTMI